MSDDNPVLLLPAETLIVLEGRTLQTTRLDGTKVDVRLFTAEEYLAAQHTAVEAVEELIGRDSESMKIDMATAVKMTKPVRIS